MVTYTSYTSYGAMCAPFLACDFAGYEHVHSSDLRCLPQMWLFRLNVGYHNVENRASHLQRMAGFRPPKTSILEAATNAVGSNLPFAA